MGLYGGKLKMKFRNLLTAAVALGLIASANPTQQFLAQEESESEVSTEVSESSDNATENTDEETSEVVSEDSSTESNVELSEEEASKLAIYLRPSSDFDESKNLTHEEINEKYDLLVEEGQTNSELTPEDVIEIFGEPGYESSYGDSEFIHYLAIDEESAIQVKIQFYDEEGLYQVTKEVRDISAFDPLDMTPEEALDYHENNGVTFDELVEKLGEPSQIGYFFNSGNYEAIWVTRAEDAGEVQYIAVDYNEPAEEVLSFYSDSSYDALNNSEDSEDDESSAEETETTEDSEVESTEEESSEE